MAGRAGRGGRARRGDRAGGGNADDHAERAAGRQPARLSRSVSGLDLLELFAFVHPARFAVPTPQGLARALGLAEPESDEGAATFLREAAATLLDTLARRLAGARGRLGLGAGALPPALDLGGRGRRAAAAARARGALAVLPPARMGGERRPAAAAPDPARPRRHRACGWRSLVGEDAEVRDGQRDYAAAAAAIFDPRRIEDQPNLLLAEAGTGIGKTLGYLAPASLWAEKADGAVWISTYTKALQRQLDREGERLFPDAAERQARDRDPQGAGELSLPAEPRGRAAGRLCRPRRDPRPARRALGGLYARRRHGRRRPAGLADLALPPRRGRRRSPTGAANASMPAARITAAASSSAPPAPARTPIWSSPTMPWSWSMPRAAARRAGRRPGSCSTRAITSSTPPIRPSPPPSPARRRSSCAAGSSAPKAGRAAGGAASPPG